jgi:hypothetical protein
VVEGARLESVYSGNAIAGSNPALSAKEMKCPEGAFLISRALKARFQKRVETKMKRREAPSLHFFCWPPPRITAGNPALSAEISYFRFKEIKKARKYSSFEYYK